MSLSERIEFRVSEKMKNDVIAAAKAKGPVGLNVAEYIRWLIRKDLKTNKILKNDRGAE